MTRILLLAMFLFSVARSSFPHTSPQRRVRRTRARSVVFAIAALVIGFLNIYPWPAGSSGPIIFGILPASLGAWIVWMLLFVALIAYIAFWEDPYGWVNDRRQQLHREKS